ncbi:MAG: hypothetical protein QM808_15355 [Steroidobacteraceae bacterium]
MPASLALLAWSLLPTAAAAGLSNDACASLVPPALAARVTADFSAYQLPSSDDAGEGRNAALNASGSWPCPFVVLGDFDGNGTLDRALLLKSRQGGNAGNPRLIGALNNNGQWQVTLSEDWPLALGDSELVPKEAGFYQREEAIKQPVEQLDQLASLQTDYASFTAGKMGGQFAIYALVNGKWQKLTLNEQ